MSQESQPTNPRKKLSAEEIIVALLDCTKKMGRVPAQEEFCRMWNISFRNLKSHFGKYGQLLRAAGLEKRGCGHRASMAELFADWAGIVRKSGRTPTILQYEAGSRYSIGPLKKRFGAWANVPLAMAQYAQKNGLEDEWKDVLEIVSADREPGATPDWNFSAPSRTNLRTDRPIYGESLAPLPMSYAPTNEHGVLFLFGKLADELGFAVMRLQSEFPDCKAMRRVDEKRWQEVWIELEFESRNFLTHMHDVAGCDLIVCWEHNWPECPLEVVELKKVVKARR
jgi:HNH endonuclease